MRPRPTIEEANTLVLSVSELRILTGRRQRNRVIEWLVENGIRHYTGADGWPRVLHSDLRGEGKVKYTELRTRPRLG